jgi:hypothetical protein
MAGVAPDGGELVRFRAMKPRHANAHPEVRGAKTGTPRSPALRRAVVNGSFVALLAVAAVCGGVARADADEPHAAAATAAAQAAPGGMSPEEIEREAEAIARSIMSPFCPGRTVSACPNAGPWRDEIRKWVAEGVEPLEIKRRLGERVPEHNLMGVPKNRLGWVLPVGLGIGAIGTLVFLLRYLIGAKPPAPRNETGSKAAVKPDGSKAEPVAEKAAPDELAAKTKGTPAAAKANGEDWDARLEEELETLDQ